MTKPEHFVCREDTCGTCTFNREVREYCSCIHKHVVTHNECEKHQFIIPQHKQFNCWCQDFTKDLGDMP